MPTPYAPDSYVSNPAQTDFPITFPYLRASHLTVTDDAVLVSANDYTLVTGGTVVRFDVAPATSSVIVISRVTPNGADYRLIDYVAGAGVSETELDEADQQLHYSLEELTYNTDAAALAVALAAAAASAQAAETAETNAETAETNAETAETNAEIAQAAAEAAALTATLMRNYISGFTLVRTSSTVITVGDGVAMNSTNAEMINLAASATITLTVSGVGGLGVARPSGVATWFHAFAVKRTSNGTVYVYADTSFTAANKPGAGDAGTHRRVGSFLLDASAPGITIDFSQFGEEFLWVAPVLDWDVATPGTGEVLRALTVPPDLKVHALVNVIGDFTDAQGGYLSSPDVSNQAAAGINGVGTSPLATFGGGANSGRFNAVGGVVSVRTNTAKQIRTRMNADVRIKIATLGWMDQRGKNG